MIGRGIAARIALAALASAAVGLAILAVGVTVVGAEVFTDLMVEAGDSAEHARAMYDESVTHRRHRGRRRGGARQRRPGGRARPDARATAGRGRSGGAADRRRRLRGPRPARGARGARLAGRFVQPDGGQPRAPGADAPRLHRQRRARAADAADQPAGLPRGAPRRRHPGRSSDLRVAAGTRPSAWSACRARSMRWPRAMPSTAPPAARGARPRGGHPGRPRPRPADPRAGRPGASSSTSPTPLPARANPDHLAQVLAQPRVQRGPLHAARAARSTIRAERRPADLLVSIANTGEGIPPDDLERVFERFYRVEKSRDRARGGAGIGLAIVKQLVEAGGGRVGAESRRRPDALLVQPARPDAGHGQADRDHPDRDADQAEPLDRLAVARRGTRPRRGS